MRRIAAAIAIIVVACTARTIAASLRVAAGFTIEHIATVPGARELAVAPNGDLFAGTTGGDVYVVGDAESKPAAPAVFVHMSDEPAAGVLLAGQTLYIGTQFGVWKVPYRSGDRRASATPRKITSLRTSGVSSDHLTTTLALSGNLLYASVGSSCNVCDPELDSTRATIQEMDRDGGGRRARAVHIRNAIALAVNPQTGSLWAAVAGQDELAHGHPYEFFDAVSAHAGIADYGWPHCYEDRRPVSPKSDCSHAVVPRVIFPAYETPIGAVFYPASRGGKYAFPPPYRGGAFVTLHGSWHTPLVAPRVVFVPMHGDAPSRPADWHNPATQWSDFVSGFQLEDGTRVARPAGIAVGPQGTLFFSDDRGGGIYRIRPGK